VRSKWGVDEPLEEKVEQSVMVSDVQRFTVDQMFIGGVAADSSARPIEKFATRAE